MCYIFLTCFTNKFYIGMKESPRKRSSGGCVVFCDIGAAMRGATVADRNNAWGKGMLSEDARPGGGLVGQSDSVSGAQESSP